MKFNLDNLATIHYSNFTMQNLKVIKAEIEEKIRGLQNDLDVVNNALKIQKKHSGAKFVNGDFPTEDNFPSNEEIEEAILKIKAEFRAKQVPAIIQKTFPDRTRCSPNAVAFALHKLIKEKKLEYVRERAGRTPAIYIRKH